MGASTLKNARILIVDDEPANVSLLEYMLAQEGYTKVTSTTDSSEVVALCTRSQFDLVLMDLHMPRPDGFEVMELLAPWMEVRWFPILVLTADVTPEAKNRALSCGAKDFVTKPFETTEVLLRIQNLLEVRFLQLELRKHNLALEQRVSERTHDLRDARLEMLERLALAAEYRDDVTGEHTKRVGRTSGLVARALGLSDDDVELLTLSAPLHDVGKIGIPDRVLLKPGTLTAEEFEIMKRHTEIGQLMLSGSRSPLLQMAEQIVATHHEWWDGKGYPAGLSGKEIPIAGRVVAIADVFDALTHDRPYKLAWSLERAVEEIRRSSGQQFDPEVVEAFESLDHKDLLLPVGIPLVAASPNGAAS